MKKLEIINKKRISSFLFIAMLMITIMGTVVQAAGNYKDADIFIHYSGDGGDVGTKEREKKDYTSSYVYNTKSDCDFFVNVYGTQKADGTRAFKNCSINQFKDIQIGHAYYLTNYVKEWGYSYCKLMITSSQHCASYIIGKWSPDSV